MAYLRDKLANAKVKDLSSEGAYLVDRAETEELYDGIVDGDYDMPAGLWLILKDGDATDVRIGTGGDWSSAIVINSSAGSALDAASIEGYDAEEEQTLQNLEGVLTWVTNS